MVTALLVKIRSPGPAFFSQERVARNGRRFQMYKFRTMCIDAEDHLADLEHLNEVDGAAFKLALDPRITKVGSVLRKFSIDELPQLVNVLKGEMSMVGPRPLPLRDFERFDGDEYRRRFSVPPGAHGKTHVPRWGEFAINIEINSCSIETMKHEMVHAAMVYEVFESMVSGESPL